MNRLLPLLLLDPVVIVAARHLHDLVFALTVPSVLSAVPGFLLVQVVPKQCGTLYPHIR